MSLILPPSKNYQSPLIPIVSKFGMTPPEGQQQIPIELDWTTMGMLSGAATYAVSINLQNNTTMAFSQIAALKVDNSQCGSDVQFIFTDTAEVVTIPAYDPCTVVPVFTASRSFFAVALNGQPNDVTRVQILNFVPPPIYVGATQSQNFATVAAMVANGAVNTKTVIPAGVSGTLEEFQLSFSIGVGPAAVSQAAILVYDGASSPNYLVNTLAVQVGPNTSTPGTTLLNLTAIDWRFSNGLTVQWGSPTGSWSTGGLLNVTAAYRTP